MKFSKKLFKRLLTVSLSAAMLTSTISSASVFASTGILAPSDQTITNMTTMRTQNLNGYMDHVGSAGGDVTQYTVDAMILKSNKDKNGEINKSNSTLAVSKAISLSTDPDSNVKNIFMFNLKSDVDNDKNTDHAFRVLMMAGTDWNTSKNQITAFEMDKNNALGMNEENGGWGTTLKTDGAYIVGQSDKTYRVVMILKKTGIDYIVDGKNIGSIKFGEQNNAWMSNADKFYMWFIVDDKIGDASKEVKYHLSDFICIKGAGSFVAEADGAVYGKGEKAVVNFSMPVANKDLQGVKIFESATGNEVACTSEFVGEKLNVKIDGDLNSQAEYRIELPAYKDCIGNDLVNDNVYFNAPKMLKAATEVFNDDFSEYSKTINVKEGWEVENQAGDTAKEDFFKNNNIKYGNSTYAPKLWGLNNLSWKAGNIILEPENVDTKGTVLKMGLCPDNDWGASNLLYRRLENKYNTGIMNIEYDLSLQKMVNSSQYEKDVLDKVKYLENQDLNSFNMILYKDELPLKMLAGSAGAGFDTKGISVNRIFGVQNKKFAVYTDNKKANGLYGASASVEKELENVTSESWYKIKHTIDLDNNSIKTYIGTTDADMQLFGANKLSDFGITDGLVGIGFSIDGNSFGTVTYVDNVKVSHAGFDTSNGVSAVRYSAGNDKNYGSSDSTDTLINKIAVAFTAVPDTLTKDNFSISDGDNSIDFDVEQDASATNTYVLSLKDYLTANTQYTLNVTGVTFDGNTETMAGYTHTIKADEDGVFEVKPMKIFVNDAEQSNGAICPLTKDDKVKASVEVINTTGKENKVTLSMGMYKDYLLNEFDFRDVTLNGTTDKYENVSFELTAGDDAANITSVNAYLWDTLATMKPYQDVCGISCTTQNAE